jgi:hypothetical protein
MTVFLALLLSAAPEAKPDLAMMDMKAVHGVPDSLAQVLNESFLVALKESGKLGNVVGGSDLRAMLDLEQQKQALGCGDDGCLAELGGALGVPYLFYTSLAKVGSNFVMHFKIMAVEESKVVVRGMRTASDEDKLLGLPQILVSEAMTKMFGGAPSAPAASTAVSVEKAPSQPVSWSRWAGAGLSAVGLGVAAMGYSAASSAQATYDGYGDNPNSDQVSELNASVASANTLWVGGLSTGALGLVLAVMAP